ncbi:death-associated protein kinase related [Drosophila ficusphila]|uniref:death-associated protein kinase related n=1 Tax=Drosophila ficusphila TaxID=30025 RepID=UPI0007E85B20|nr:death-associated protein kinase related [Drosophila ficusphila]XP_017045514.1 death-associated protein kinase related [Drosophila ficusphila]
MFTEKGIFPIGDGLLDVDADRLKGLLVSCHDINEIYEVEQTPFARGKFAAVRRAINKNTGSHFAAKFLKRRRRAQSSDKEIKHEIAVLMLCEGEDNIVNLNAVHETRSDTALLLELATGGELQTILDNEECLTEAQARHCMREVLKALRFLHDRSIAHLDLKPQNILLAGERIEDGLKLCDFGISRVVCEGINVREMAGTPDYVAPEVLQYEPLSLLTDIWSVGVLTYVLLSGFSPFGGDTKQETFLNISQCALTFPDNLFGGVSPVAIDFIRRALRIKPNDRMSAAGCLEHVWLKDDCSLDRQIYMQPQSDAEEEEDDDEVEDEEDAVEEEEEEEEEQTLEEPATSEQTPQQQPQQQQQQLKQQLQMQQAKSVSHSSKPTHNGHHRANSSGSISKIPIATSKLLLSSSSCCETTTAIHTLTSNGNTNGNSSGNSNGNTTNGHVVHKPTQIVTPTRRASDSDKENTYTATFVKKPVATIQLGGSNGLEDATVVATLTLFPDAPTTPKVIRKTPTGESNGSATSVKALVKKFQLEESGGAAVARRSGGAATSPTTTTTTTVRMNGIRRASEPLTTVYKKQAPPNGCCSSASPNLSPSNPSPGSSSPATTTIASGSSGSLLMHSQRLGSSAAPATSAAATTATATSSSASNSNNSNNNSGSSSSSSGSSGAKTANSAAHHLHHHHMHHHHHHHHHHVVIAAKNAAAVAATNNLSLDQGIIC